MVRYKHQSPEQIHAPAHGPGRNTVFVDEGVPPIQDVQVLLNIAELRVLRHARDDSTFAVIK
jgi:hypothetical protein